MAIGINLCGLRGVVWKMSSSVRNSSLFIGFHPTIIPSKNVWRRKTA
jgi:hypothetical protein